MQIETNKQNPQKAVYSIMPKSDGKDFWLRIGSAFTNRDGSVTILLDALPLGAKLQIRDPSPRDGARAAQPGVEARGSVREQKEEVPQ